MFRCIREHHVTSEIVFHIAKDKPAFHDRRSSSASSTWQTIDFLQAVNLAPCQYSSITYLYSRIQDHSLSSSTPLLKSHQFCCPGRWRPSLRTNTPGLAFSHIDYLLDTRSSITVSEIRVFRGLYRNLPFSENRASPAPTQF